MSAKDSVVAPRWETRHHEDTFDPNPVRTATASAIRYWHELTHVGGRRAWQNRKLAFLEAASLYLDGREDVAAQADGLAALGHLVTVPEAPINIANPVMLCVDPETGEMEAAGDPLAGRHAAALP